MLQLNKYIIGCVALTVFFSCKKDESYDVKGNGDTVFFTNNMNLGNAPGNSVSFSVTNIPDGASTGYLNLTSGLPATIKIPVFANKPVSREVTVNAELDNSLVAVYNAAHNTSYVQLPASILNTQALSARIEEGRTTATDSLSLVVNPTDLKTLTQPMYMAPLRLTTVSDPSVGRVSTDTATSIVYVVMNVELRLIRYLATAADMTGTLQSKSAWTVGFTPAPAAATMGSVIDGSTTTYSRWAASPVQVDLDMLAAKNVTGFRLYSTTSTTLIPTQIEVSTSEDGINYKLTGTPLRANLNYASGYNYVSFYRAIPARYLRLKVSYGTSTNTQNFRIAELDVYAN